MLMPVSKLHCHIANHTTLKGINTLKSRVKQASLPPPCASPRRAPPRNQCLHSWWAGGGCNNILAASQLHAAACQPQNHPPTHPVTHQPARQPARRPPARPHDAHPPAQLMMPSRGRPGWMTSVCVGKVGEATAAAYTTHTPTLLCCVWRWRLAARPPAPARPTPNHHTPTHTITACSAQHLAEAQGPEQQLSWSCPPHLLTQSLDALPHTRCGPWSRDAPAGRGSATAAGGGGLGVKGCVEQ